MGKREIFVVVCMVLFCTYIATATETNSSLEIDNSPPALISNIKNYSWENGSFSNVFDLDNHFKDWEGNTLSYVAETGNQISISIGSGNIVSFSAIATEITEFFTINATDEQFITTSNIFQLFVGADIIPPKWFNPRKTETKIYEGDTVTFLTDWTDERALSKYDLLLNEGPGWAYYPGTLSGREATSNKSVAITATANETVYWKMCGEDTSQNQNCTEIYEFSVRPEQEASDEPSDDSSDDSTEETSEESEDGEEGEISIPDRPDPENIIITEFQTDLKAILISIKQGTTETEALEITNTGSTDLDFSLAIQSVEEFVSLSNTNFTIKSGESKKITLEFTAGITTTPKDYYGNLVIISEETAIIPIAININSANIDYEITVEVKDKTIKPGNLVVANLILKNNGDKVPLKVDLYYAIKDYYGTVYNFSDEELSLGAEATLTKELIIPKEALLGEYLFYASIENEKGMALNSDTFTVGVRFQLQALIKYSVAFAIILFLSIVSIVLIYRYQLHKKRYKSINLYVKLSEMKDLIKEKKYDQAAKYYIEVKKIYGEKVSKEELQNKEKLAKAMEALAKKINFDDIVEEATKPAPAAKPGAAPAKPEAPAKPTEPKPAAPAKPEAPAKPTEPKPTPAKPAPPTPAKPTTPTTPPKPIVKPASPTPAKQTSTKPAPAKPAESKPTTPVKQPKNSSPPQETQRSKSAAVSSGGNSPKPTPPKPTPAKPASTKTTTPPTPAKPAPTTPATPPKSTPAKQTPAKPTPPTPPTKTPIPKENVKK